MIDPTLTTFFIDFLYLIRYNADMENENTYTVKKLSKFDDYIKKLKDTQAKVSIFRRIDRLKKGNFGDCKSVGEGAMPLS